MGCRRCNNSCAGCPARRHPGAPSLSVKRVAANEEPLARHIPAAHPAIRAPHHLLVSYNQQTTQSDNPPPFCARPPRRHLAGAVRHHPKSKSRVAAAQFRPAPWRPQRLANCTQQPSQQQRRPRMPWPLQQQQQQAERQASPASTRPFSRRLPRCNLVGRGMHSPHPHAQPCTCWRACARWALASPTSPLTRAHPVAAALLPVQRL